MRFLWGQILKAWFLNLTGDFMFDYGSAKLREPVIPVLKKVAATLNTERYNSFNFEISGHTSDQPFSSPQYPSNWELSSARAAAVVRFLRAAEFPGSVCGPLACMMLRRSILTVIGMMCLFRKTGRKTAGWKSILCHHLSKFEKARFGGFFSVKANGVCGRKSRGGRVFSVGRDCDI